MSASTDTKDMSGNSVAVEKSEVVHHETDSSSSRDIKEAPPSTDLTAKQQYAKLWSAIKAEKQFVWWTLYTMLLVFSWGYDVGLSGIAIAFPEFREVYGNYFADGQQWVIPALWQSLWNAASTIGQVFGGFLAGQFADTFGRKALLYLAVILSIGSSFALVFAPSLPVLFVSKLLLGFSIGFATVIPPLYVTENAPAHLRSTASSLTNVVIVFGQFAAHITGFGASHINGPWSFRLAFCMTFLMPTIYLVGLPFFPESPVWYMKKGREEKAYQAARKLFGPNAPIHERLDTLKEELRKAAEDDSAVSQTSWRALFTKENRTRTLVSTLGLQSQNFSGGYFGSYAPAILSHSYSIYFPLTLIQPTRTKPTTLN